LLTILGACKIHYEDQSMYAMLEIGKEISVIKFMSSYTRL